MENQDDARMLQLIKTDKYKAFEQIQKKYIGNVRLTAFYEIGDGDEANDIAQEVFIKLWLKIDSINVHTSLLAYLTQSVRYECRNKRKKDARLPTTYEDDMGMVPDSPEEYTMKEVRYKAVNEILKNLPEKMRRALETVYCNGKKVEKLAEETGLSKNTILSQLQTGKKKIKSEFKKYFR